MALVWNVGKVLPVTRAMLVGTLVGFLVACGGGTSNRDQIKDAKAADAAAAASATTAAIVEVLTSSNTLPSAAGEAVITVFVKSGANVGLEGQTVVFSASSGTLQVTTAVTDASGAASARLTAGSDKSLRNITVTARAGSTTGSVVVPVTDTTVTVAGSGSLQSGSGASAYSVRALDSAGNAIAGAVLSASSALGNAVSPASATTNSTGVASFNYTPTVAGSDTLSVSGLGAVTKTTIVVSSIDLSVLSPASNTSIAVGASQTVTVRYRAAGVGVAGTAVTFSSTRGSFSPTVSTTDANGDASAVLSSATAGSATVVAQISGVGQVTLPVQFAAGAPSTLAVQANPGAVQPNAAGSTSNQSSIEAVVRDANGNAVANTAVSFSILQDLSNGSLSPGVALTDSNGRAQVQFISGSTSTANDGVRIQATAGAASGQTTLTVSGRALFITIAFSNTISDVDPTTYTKAFTVAVTDANGAAVANQDLTLTALPQDYNKGQMNYDATSSLWVSAPSVTCLNEDANKNGILDSGEDSGTNGNRDGKLTPGNVALITPGTVTTAATGRASFELQYGKPYATWVRVRITARGTVAGTESSQFVLLTLPVAVADIGDSTIPPAGRNSPFGQSAVCTDAL